MGSTIVAKVQEDSTPIVVLQQYEFGDSTGVLSVRIKNLGQMQFLLMVNSKLKNGMN